MRTILRTICLVVLCHSLSGQQTVVKNKKWEGFTDLNPDNTFQAKFRNVSKEIEGKDYLELMYKTEDGWFEGVKKYYRQEGKKVYRKDDGEERLIYDFGLSVGDTLQLSDQQGAIFDFFPIRTVDTLILGKSYRKLEMRVKPEGGAASNVPHVWIEGIGDTGFFFGEDYIFGNQNASPIFCVSESFPVYSALLMCPGLVSTSDKETVKEPAFFYDQALKVIHLNDDAVEWVDVFSTTGERLASFRVEENASTVALDEIRAQMCLIVLRTSHSLESKILRL